MNSSKRKKIIPFLPDEEAIVGSS